MSVRSIEALQRFLRRLCEEAVPSEDAALLNRFVAANDREAFELLIARHGPMVLGTARRLVDNSHDAEDVFQAVFLSLARGAKTIRQGRTLAAWLHKTTCRIAARVRKNRLAGSGGSPEPCAESDPATRLAWQEVRQALDEELQRLPERLRAPLLLCYLSGLTRDEAARQLGWSLGTLKRRLEQGRKALRSRLERRGIAAVGLALTVLAPEALQAAVSKSLLDSSLRLIFSTGAVVPAAISALVIGSAATLKGIAMKSALALLAAIALGVGIYAGTGQPDRPERAAGKKERGKPAPEEKAVQRDDPLPAGSTLRFGTARFRHGIPVSRLVVSADGKIAVAVNGNHVLGATRVFDLVSGRVLYTLGGWEGTAIEAAAISPDGRTIVTKQDFSLRVRDAATGKELCKIDLKRADRYSRNEWLAFTPDGKAVAVTSQGNVIHLIDFASGQTIRDFPHPNDFGGVLAIAFSPDGKLMAAGGYDKEKDDYFARLWDVATGKELRRFRHGTNGYGIRALAFSPDAKTLATGADEGRLRLFDVATGKERNAFPKDGTYMRSVAFAPDGQTVAAAGNSIRLYDTRTGKERLRIDHKAVGLHFTDGGKTLTGAVSGAIYRWDPATGKVLTPAAGDSIVEQILVTAAGTRIITRGQNGDAHLWDAATGKHLRHVPAAWQRGLALSPDGRFLVWPVADQAVKYTDPAQPNAVFTGSRLKLYDIGADRFVERFPGFKGDAQEVAFGPDGKTLITVDHGNATVRVWDVAAGKELRTFRVARESEKARPHLVWSASLSPDGTTLAVTYQRADNTTALVGAYSVRLYDVTTGAERHELPGHLSYVGPPAFSPDGKRVVTASPALAPFLRQRLRRPANQVFVWDVATGKRVAGLPDGLPVGAVAAAFSPDGRTVALARGADLGAAAGDDGTVSLYETATWTVRAEVRGGQGRVTALAFTPGGRLLTGGLDTTVLAWDLRPPRGAASGSLETAWQNLAAREAGKSFQSEGRFLAAPAEAVKLFAAKIKPVEPLNPGRVRRLLADLGSAKFADRAAAAKALQALDQRARPYLEKALTSAASAEVRVRVKKILDQHQRAAPTPDQLRRIRAVMVLELIGDGASQGLLKRWAGGPAGALLTTEAAAALKRLGAVTTPSRKHSP